MGSGVAKDTLEDLGISAKKLGELTPTKQLAVVADAIAAIPSKAGQANAAYQLFGRGGLELVNVLAQGSAELNKFGDEADAMGLSMSNEQLKSVEDINDAWTMFTASVSGAAASFTVEWAPAILGVLQDLKDLTEETKKTSKWLAQLFGGEKTMSREEALAKRDAIVASGIFPGGSRSSEYGNDSAGAGTGLPITESDLGVENNASLTAFDAAVKAAMRDVALLQGQSNSIDEVINNFAAAGASPIALGFLKQLLEKKKQLLEVEKQTAKAKAAQSQLDSIRNDDAIAQARLRVSEAAGVGGGSRFASVATRGSAGALRSILGSQGPAEQQLKEQKKANEHLAALLKAQKDKQILELTVQGAV